jgi:hypothetical protein
MTTPNAYVRHPRTRAQTSGQSCFREIIRPFRPPMKTTTVYHVLRNLRVGRNSHVSESESHFIHLYMHHTLNSASQSYTIADP